MKSLFKNSSFAAKFRACVCVEHCAAVYKYETEFSDVIARTDEK